MYGRQKGADVACRTGPGCEVYTKPTCLTLEVTTGPVRVDQASLVTEPYDDGLGRASSCGRSDRSLDLPTGSSSCRPAPWSVRDTSKRRSQEFRLYVAVLGQFWVGKSERELAMGRSEGRASDEADAGFVRVARLASSWRPSKSDDMIGYSVLMYLGTRFGAVRSVASDGGLETKASETRAT